MDAARYHVVNDPVDADSWVQPAIEQEKTLKVSFDPPYLGWNEPHDTVVAFISTQLELDLSEALVYQTHLNGSAIFIETKDPIPEHVRSGMFGQLTLGQRQHTMLKLDISYMGNPKIKVVLDNIPRRMPLEIVAKELQKAIRSETRTDLLREAPTVRRERHHRADQASAILNITEDAVPFIPHFITVGYAADTARGQQQRTSRITLRIRGRRQVCATCGKLGHFSGSKKCAGPLAPEEMGPPPPTRPTADAAIQPLMDLNLPPPSKLPKKPRRSNRQRNNTQSDATDTQGSDVCSDSDTDDPEWTTGGHSSKSRRKYNRAKRKIGTVTPNSKRQHRLSGYGRGGARNETEGEEQSIGEFWEHFKNPAQNSTQQTPASPTHSISTQFEDAVVTGQSEGAAAPGPERETGDLIDIESDPLGSQSLPSGQSAFTKYPVITACVGDLPTLSQVSLPQVQMSSTPSQSPTTTKEITIPLIDIMSTFTSIPTCVTNSVITTSTSLSQCITSSVDDSESLLHEKLNLDVQNQSSVMGSSDSGSADNTIIMN